MSFPFCRNLYTSQLFYIFRTGCKMPFSLVENAFFGKCMDFL